MHEQAFARNRNYFKKAGYEFVMKSYGKTLNGVKLKDPFSGNLLELILTKEIKGSVGTGINPICPAHNSEDFKYSQKNNLSRKGYVDEEGNLQNFSKEKLNKKNVVLDDANIAILTEFFLFLLIPF